MHNQARAWQLSGQSDANSLTTSPEYIVAYLVHALANISCPNIDDCKNVEAYDKIYRYELDTYLLENPQVLYCQNAVCKDNFHLTN